MKKVFFFFSEESFATNEHPTHHSPLRYPTPFSQVDVGPLLLHPLRMASDAS